MDQCYIVSMEIMEIAILFIIIASFGLCYLVLSNRYGLLSKKSITDIGLDKIKELHKEEVKSITDTSNVKIANLQKENAVLITQKSRANEKLNKILEANQALIDTEEGSVEYLQQNYSINPMKAVEYVKKLGMNPDALSNPALAPLVWEKLNENRDLALVMGILVPKGSEGMDTSLLQKTNETVTQTKIDPIDKIFENLEKNGNVF